MRMRMRETRTCTLRWQTTVEKTATSERFCRLSIVSAYNLRNSLIEITCNPIWEFQFVALPRPAPLKHTHAARTLSPFRIRSYSRHDVKDGGEMRTSLMRTRPMPHFLLFVLTLCVTIGAASQVITMATIYSSFTMPIRQALLSGLFLRCIMRSVERLLSNLRRTSVCMHTPARLIGVVATYDAESRDPSVVSLPLLSSLRQNVSVKRIGTGEGPLGFGGVLMAALNASHESHVLVGGEDATSCASLNLVASASMSKPTSSSSDENTQQVLIGTGCTDPQLRKSPGFFTIVPSDASFARAVVGMSLRFGWNRICLVFENTFVGRCIIKISIRSFFVCARTLDIIAAFISRRKDLPLLIEFSHLCTQAETLRVRCPTS